MKDIQCPVLILAPMNSRNTSLQDQEILRDMIPGSEMVAINGRGHEVYVDRAVECQRVFLVFLERVTPI